MFPNQALAVTFELGSTFVYATFSAFQDQNYKSTTTITTTITTKNNSEFNINDDDNNMSPTTITSNTTVESISRPKLQVYNNYNNYYRNKI